MAFNETAPTKPSLSAAAGMKLTEKLLTYGLVRKLTFADRATVHNIYEDVGERNRKASAKK